MKIATVTREDHFVLTGFHDSILFIENSLESSCFLAVIEPSDTDLDDCIQKALKKANFKANDKHVNVKFITDSLLANKMTQVLKRNFAHVSGRSYIPGNPVEIKIDGQNRKLSAMGLNPIALGKKVTRVLIVDDSKTIRQLLSRTINSMERVEIVGKIEDPELVEEAIVQLKPDVMTLDIKMPRCTGVELLRKIFPQTWVPTIIISSLEMDEGSEVLEALELGALDYLRKPNASQMDHFKSDLTEKLLLAHGFQRKIRKKRRAQVSYEHNLPIKKDLFLAMGASTGGTESIREVLTQLPPNVPPIFIVQHIPPLFSKAFAIRLNELCPFRVKEAENNERAESNTAYIAPGGFQMEVFRRSNKDVIIKVFKGNLVNGHQPSVDVLFNSVAKQIGPQAIGVLLTGMGKDGAKGLLSIKNEGSTTFAESEESCIVYGMPKAAIEMGAATESLPLWTLTEKIAKLLITKTKLRQPA